MEKLSRVRKYEDLRKQIDLNTNENETVNTTRIEPVLFKKMEVTEEKAPRREKEISLPKNNSDTFINEYMDDLIKDVKQYNREKGLLNSDVTEIDILNQLKNPTRLRREDYVKPIEEVETVNEKTIVQSKNEIAMQIQELIKEDTDTGMNITKIETNTESIGNTQEFITEKDNKELELLNEKTQQIQIQIEKHEEEMNELSQGIDKTNKLLNVLLVFLIIALFLVIGFTVYVVLKSSGRI